MTRFQRLAVATTISTMALVAWGGRRARHRVGRRVPGLAEVLRQLGAAVGVPHADRVHAPSARRRLGAARGGAGRRRDRGAGARPAWAAERHAALGRLDRRRARAAVRRAGGARRRGREQRPRPRRGHAALRPRDDRARRAGRRHGAGVRGRPTAPATAAYARLAMVTAVATFALLLVGTYVRAEGAGLAFRDWPLMGGRLVPSFGPRGAAEMFAHRVLAIVGGRARALAASFARARCAVRSTGSSASRRWPAGCSWRRSRSAASTWPRSSRPGPEPCTWRCRPRSGPPSSPSRWSPAREPRLGGGDALAEPTGSGGRGRRPHARSATRSPPTTGSRSRASSCCC